VAVRAADSSAAPIPLASRFKWFQRKGEACAQCGHSHGDASMFTAGLWIFRRSLPNNILAPIMAEQRLPALPGALGAAHRAQRRLD
jgi:hypothetical protein